MSSACIRRTLLAVSQSFIPSRCNFLAVGLHFSPSPAARDRQTAYTNNRRFSSFTRILRSENKVTVNFINRDGQKITVKGAPGDSLLDIVIEQNLDIDGFGACEGTLACSTCHLIFEEDVYSKLGPITDEEMDMLDLAYGLTDTSRLGCQICLTKSLEGITVRVPESAVDIRQPTDAGTSSSA
ncbi:adrenodoxin [Brienomyrus brachyistius]|uniref:adrenodoxin n=1 Tax=Brienomyrus brachyistius TaxID=42636 RepID=UPI0020B200A8|nr:adrenodoxin [Brienomyrus brachyistius]